MIISVNDKNSTFKFGEYTFKHKMNTQLYIYYHGLLTKGT